MLEWATAVGTALFCVAALYVWRRTLKNQAFPLPPGPPGLPWVGTVIGIDPRAPWVTYAEWARTYGDLVYTRLMGRDIIIINSEKIAKDLLDNRSRNYSDRPRLATIELYGVSFSSLLMPYGDRWKLHRQFFHQTFRINAVSRFVPYQHRKACHLLRQLLDNPGDLDGHVFEYTVSIILNCVYNYDPASRKDKLVEIMENVLNIVVPAFRTDVSIIIGAFPFLLYLPSWFPGMSFKKNMAKSCDLSKEYLERPFEHCLQNMAPNGDDAPSMVRDALRSVEKTGISPETSWMQALKEASGTVFLAASETSSSVIMTFFLLIMLNPEAQEKAQAQIDDVVGNTRLPTIEDRQILPFIDAIFWETLRYSPIAPLSLPHAAVDDNMYNGFRIPKGATVLANVWSMAHDESKYPNPHEFIPERFLNDDGSLKSNEMIGIAFGFGRRICAGRHFAETSVWSIIAKVLAVFRILKPLDENGVEITVEPRFSTGIAIHPLPFRYRIVPRFPDMDAENLERLITASMPGA